MKVIFKYITLVNIVFLLLTQAAFGVAKEQPLPPHQWIEEYQKQKDYQYKETLEGNPQSPWDVFLRWIKNLISNLFYNTVATKFWRYFMYAVALAIVAGAIWYFNRYGKGIWQNDPSKRINTGVVTEDIHQLDFEKLIQESVQAGNYKWAMRWQYLHYLKKLDELGLINWLQYKTNTDYKYEIADSIERSKFSRIARRYEDAWYGEWNPQLPDYESYVQLISSQAHTYAA